MRKNFAAAVSVFALIAIFSAMNVFAALNGYLKIEGKKGVSKIVRCTDGTCAVDGLDAGTYTVTLCDAKGTPRVLDASTKLSFTYDVKSPRDVATGQASGKRMHKPIMITKEFNRTKPDNMITIVDNGSSITFKTSPVDSWNTQSSK